MPRNNLTYSVTNVNKVNRYKHQASYDLSLIHTIVNSSDVLHVSFIGEDGLPTIIPLIGQMGSFERPSAGVGEPMDVYLHGYVSSRIMNLARDGEKDAGMKICVCATKVDGLVLSLTPNSHSYNYRSAVLHGVATLVTDTAEKLWAMELITDSVCPARWHNSRVPPDGAEMSSTQIMRMKIESGSAKVREGVPNDHEKDLSRPEVVEKIWTGVVPLYNTLAEPIPGPYNHISHIPTHVGEYVEERNLREREYAMAAATKPAPVKPEKSDD